MRKLFAGIFGLFGLMLVLLSCSTVTSGVEHAHLETQAKMSNTIFLNPVSPSKKTIYVQIRNTSDVPMKNLKAGILELLQNKGYKIVQDPYKAEFWLQSNVLYMGKESKHATMAGALAGGFGGALIGSAFGSGYGKAGAAGAGSLIGSGLGMLAGAAIHVDTYIGVVDIQVKQKVNGNVKTETNSNLQNGIGTTVKSNYKQTTNYQAYRTRIAVSATQTNIDLAKATPVIENKLASEIAGIFE